MNLIDRQTGYIILFCGKAAACYVSTAAGEQKHISLLMTRWHMPMIFISHKRSRVWTRYFTKLCIIISPACVIFLVNLDDFFNYNLHEFSQHAGFHSIRCHYINIHYIYSRTMQNSPWQRTGTQLVGKKRDVCIVDWWRATGDFRLPQHLLNSYCTM